MLNRLADLIRQRPQLDEAIRGVSPVAPPDLSELPVGTELQAKVAAALPNRVYQVVIGERVYTLPLPIDAQPGDEIQLTVLERDTRSPAPRPDRPARAEGGAVTILSPTARFITALLNTPARPLLAGPATASQPLLPAPPGAPAAIAARLTEALAESGMFYESHQAQWVAGERSLMRLLQEPQARIPPLPPADTLFPAGEPTAAARGPVSVGDSSRVPEAPVHPALRRMVKEQLETLSTLQVAWQGQIWPGQDVFWEIAEKRPQRDAGTDAASTWQTRLALKLPRLGEVHAVVSVGAAGVGITLSATGNSTLEAMKESAGILRSALGKAGLRAASFRIDQSRVDRGQS